MQKMWVQFAKRGRLRFTSHRDFQRAFERAVRRAGVPVAYSHGFTPHPKVSFIGAAPTGCASEAEYLEISLTDWCAPEQVRSALDDALPPGLDVITVAEADADQVDSRSPSQLPSRASSLASWLAASWWEIALPGAEAGAVGRALDAFLAAESVAVERLTKKGTRSLDARGAVLYADMVTDEGADADAPAIRCVIEHQEPTVRPEEMLGALRVVAEFEAPAPPRVTRLAQGTWDAEAEILKPPPL
ncbi:DUF2344 domain-containing protein [Actinobacteria bacterium YIM 96077]|uniref:Radical SAM protein n=1 Tax=Phytoactinopolyspora halophila TaxID=1981511 RepID=A0A329QS14_9ACTN|nr:DUF2344 domain-containing protein [Actinobacteria bacterium YIM 96077]RAW14886.1 radical SAM protein [Phytoactinopolyspora halophila]